MSADILPFRRAKGAPKSVTDPMLDDVMEWVRLIFRDIIDGPMPATIAKGDTIALSRTCADIAAYDSGKPFTTKQLRAALWHLDSLLVTRDRIIASRPVSNRLALQRGPDL